ncbi:hypothetical protein D9M71_741900 [compost metagenome]
MAADTLKQPIPLALVKLANVEGIAGLGDLGVFCQQAPHLQRPAGLLDMALDEIVGVLGRADQAQAQGRGFDGPAGVTEDTQYYLGDCLGALLCLGGGCAGVCPGSACRKEQDGQQ